MAGHEALVAAVDLGASSGRVVLGHVGRERLELEETARFPHRPVRLGRTLHWDVPALLQGALDGLRAAAARHGRLDAVGVDTWAVDYGLLGADGELVGLPVCYRDERTNGVMAAALDVVPAREVYATTGIQFLPFNTCYQLLADQGSSRGEAGRTMLLLPDLLVHWLSGSVGAEITNASTTQLLDATTRTWSEELLDRWGLDPALLPPLRQPGDACGALLPHVAEEVGAAAQVVAVGSHDTASAVVAVPATQGDFAYVSSGTWSLVGVELDRPVLTEESRAAGFTNELGVDGTVRYLRNVMGLWLLQESVRTWRRQGLSLDLPGLLAAAGAVPDRRSVVDVDLPAFLPPGQMPERIASECRRTGQPVPHAPAEVVRCVLDSLAVGYRRAVRDAARLSGRPVDVVHVVGGGSRNALLCQLTADACGAPVLAGPAEASALGNVLVQGRAIGAYGEGADLAALRRLVRRAYPPRRYLPRPDVDAQWDEAERRAAPG